MEDEKLEQELFALKRAHVEQGAVGRFRVPAEWVPRIVAHVKRRRAEGESMPRVGLRLGVPQSTLWCWMARAERERKEATERGRYIPPYRPEEPFVPVLVRSDDTPAPAPSEAGPLCLRCPRGFFVPGLSLDELAELLRRLG